MHVSAVSALYDNAVSTALTVLSRIGYRRYAFVRDGLLVFTVPFKVMTSSQPAGRTMWAVAKQWLNEV